MPHSVRRRELLTGAGAAVIVSALQGCGLGVRTTELPRAEQLVLPRIRASTDRITRITVCTRPFRAQGPRLEIEQIGQKNVVHNYGHGGSGWSLSWGSSAIAVRKALATGERDIAVIGIPTEGNLVGNLTIARDDFSGAWAAEVMRQLRARRRARVMQPAEAV